MPIVTRCPQSDLQFGFKKKLECSKPNAVYTLCSVVDYYTSRGSTVNLCTLDVSKTFHKIDHHCLYLKLMKC